MGRCRLVNVDALEDPPLVWGTLGSLIDVNLLGRAALRSVRIRRTTIRCRHTRLLAGAAGVAEEESGVVQNADLSPSRILFTVRKLVFPGQVGKLLNLT